MRLLRTLALTGALLCAGSATADGGGWTVQGEATKTPQITDRLGDANGVNGQALQPDAPNDVATDPASVSSHDILSAKVATYGRYRYSMVRGRRTRVFVPEGVLVTMDLAAAPANGAYRVRGYSALCDTVMFQYFVDLAGASGYLRHTCTESGTPPPEFYDVPVAASVSGKTVTWRASFAQLPKQLNLGTAIAGLTAETMADGGVVTFPVLDDAITTATYRVGE